jgi:hypothetical protein
LLGILLIFLAAILNFHEIGFWNNIYLAWLGIILMLAGLIMRYWAAKILGEFYIGKCPDLITGIHGDDPVKLYSELCEVVEEVIQHFEAEGKALPPSRTRPMQEVF